MSNIVYVNNSKQKLSANAKDSTKDAFSRNYLMALEDIAQSHFFKITISKIKIEYDHPTYGRFLPVKQCTFNYVNFESMGIPVGIYGSLPILKRRSVGRLNLTLYDNDRDEIEKSLRIWLSECFPEGKYVNYLSNTVAELKYYSYNVKGKLNKDYPLTYMVIPADTYQVSRSYEENNAKVVQISFIVVGGGAGNYAAGTQDQPYPECVVYPECKVEDAPNSNGNGGTYITVPNGAYNNEMA